MRERISTCGRLLAGALALLFAPDCATDPGDAESTAESALDESRGVVLSAAIWTLAWDRTGAAEVDGALEIDTDLGYRVRLDQARIVSHSVSLGQCDPPGSAPAESALWSLPVRSAHAHTEGADPSEIEASLIEDLLAGPSTDVASSFPPARYCRLHWLLARPMTATQGPADVPMEGRSVLLGGTFEKGGSTGSFDVDTWWPHGSLTDLWAALPIEEYEAARQDGRARHVFVTVTRRLGGLFDGIDFEQAGEDEIAGKDAAEAEAEKEKEKKK